MIRLALIAVACLAAERSALAQARERSAPIREIGGARQLFVDDYVVESLEGVHLALGTPRDEGAVFRFDRSWEGPFCGYSTVIRDGDRFLLYYRGLPEAGADGSDRETTCVALSTDGRSWTRPELGFFEVDGTRANNVVLAGAAPASHNFCPFLDRRPGVDPSQRFKALGGSERSGLIAFTSADGLRWTRLREEPVLTGGQFDSQNVAFWSELEGSYVCYFRTWTGDGYSGYRTVSRSTSADFVEWTDPVPMQFGDTEPEHIYIHQTHPYFRAPEVYVAIAARFMPGRQVLSAAEAERLGVNPRYFKDCSDAVLMTSRGGDTYDRTFLESFIRPGIGLENWVSRSNFPGLNVVRTGPNEMSLYVNQNYAQPTAELRRYSLRLDGFASMRAPARGGEWTSRPLVFEGARLELNASTSARGGIRVEVQDEEGNARPGFALDDSIEWIGNETARTVSWRGGADVSELAGEVVQLRFAMQDADLYSFRFADDGAATGDGPRVVLKSAQRIWDEAPHNAFTDLVEVGGRLFCAFREGERHVYGADGKARVIVQEPSGEWRSVALLAEEGVDLRDPKLSEMPDGRIMMVCGATYYDGRTFVKRESRVAFADPQTGQFGELLRVKFDEAIRSDNDWLWRVTWFKGVGYGIVYQAFGDREWGSHLVATRDGATFDLVATLDVDGRPNETSLRFRDDGRMVALMRREAGDRLAVFGSASPPYTDWRFQRLPERVGGPNLIALDESSWLITGRRYSPQGAQTVVARLHEHGTWSDLLTLPSGGDTSYPGLVHRGDELLVSYYSSHEGQTAIYLATLGLER